MTSGFCFYCGTSPVDLLSYKGNDYSCSICRAIFVIERIKAPELTLEEAEAKFNQIPLTDKNALFAKKRNERKTNPKIV